MSLRWKVAQAAEIRWWQGYLKKKPKADYLEWKRNYWLDLIQKTGLSIEKGEQILDAGCGPAGIFMALPDAKVDAVDPLLNNYENKLAHFNKSMYPEVRFFNASLEAYECSYSYDKIFCLNAINHVADLSLSIDKLVGMLKPNGHLIMSIDAHNYTLFKKLFSWLPGDILHPHQYDLKEYEAMLTERNLTIKDSVLMKEEFFFNYFMLVAKLEY